MSFTVSQSLLKFTSTESVMLFNHLILCHPLLLLPSVFPSIRIFFQWVCSSHQMAKVSELQVQHPSPSSEGLSVKSIHFIVKNIQGWFPLVLTGLISLLSKGLWRVYFSTTVQEHQFLGAGCSVNKESTCTAGDLSLIPAWEDPVGKEMATNSSILAWKILWGAWWATVHGFARVGHELVIKPRPTLCSNSHIHTWLLAKP